MGKKVISEIWQEEKQRLGYGGDPDLSEDAMETILSHIIKVYGDSAFIDEDEDE